MKNKYCLRIKNDNVMFPYNFIEIKQYVKWYVKRIDPELLTKPSENSILIDLEDKNFLDMICNEDLKEELVDVLILVMKDFRYLNFHNSMQDIENYIIENTALKYQYTKKLLNT
jgi:hypothetical protein